MDRSFDYDQKVLLAVEFGDTPRRLEGMPASYALFRIPIPDVVRAFDESHGRLTQLLAGRRFHDVLDRHMGYWEKLVPAGQQCFVHYAIGAQQTIAGTFDRLKSAAADWVMLGTYHMEPQCSAYPFGFPMRSVPDHWFLGEERRPTEDSVFWFNFFPAQPYLFEKTFAVWALFQTQQFRALGECNQLVVSEGKAWLIGNGVADLIQVNLNRFTSLPGFFNSAHEAGKYTFTVDPEYIWYGMLLNKL